MVGRPREFETEEVLDLSIELFREYGFAATSIQDIVDFTGVGRQSLYNAFGDKRALYLASLDHYLAEEEERLEPLERRGAGIEGIGEFFERRVAALAETEPARACFVASTAIEVGDRDEEIGTRIDQHVRALEDALGKALRSARRKGELVPEVPLPGLARTLLALHQGLGVLARCGSDETDLRSLVDATLRLIRA